MRGVTALQMDIKIQGVTENIMEDASIRLTMQEFTFWAR
ncbi:MAG: hypothetical protein Ct9H300mP8_06660 [Gammaproteobacteria bacterium]|nr:MAG: hypothetical protein Ct9H300mP8_06660 [Gammaproteobacteria bacterium]